MRTLILFLEDSRTAERTARLHARLGAEGAASLHRAFVEDLTERFRHFPESEFRCAHPEPADPGSRMHASFAAAHEEGSEAMVLFGADLPTLGEERVREAFDALDTHDVVLGPARDGGYYLVGLRRPIPDLFERIPWSTYAVLAETLARAWRLELKVAMLAEECGVGTEADLAELLNRHRENAATAGTTATTGIGPATAQFLDGLS